MRAAAKGKTTVRIDALAPIAQAVKRIGEQPEAAHGYGCRRVAATTPQGSVMDIDDRTEAFHRTVAHLLNLEILNHHSFRLAIRMAYAKMVWPEKFDEMISLLESEYGSGHVRSILRFSEPSQTTITTPQSS